MSQVRQPKGASGGKGGQFAPSTGGKTPPSARPVAPSKKAEEPKRYSPPLMKCGHISTATKGGKPVCGICHKPGCEEISDKPIPSGEWLCIYCNKTSPRPISYADTKTMQHYDGCRGWD